MRIITNEREYTGRGAVLALGMFDGVHIGHRALIGRAVELAKKLARTAWSAPLTGIPAACFSRTERRCR